MLVVELARKLRPELVFLDLSLPGISGFEVARRLKKDFGDSIRIVAVTALNTDQDREKSAKAGCELHLAKPVQPRAIEHLFE